MTSWKDLNFDKTGKRKLVEPIKQAEYIGGEEFDSKLDEMVFNRVIRFKNLDNKPQGADKGKVYWNNTEGKVKIWVGGAGKWADLVFTSTSTSTTSTSTTSTSTSTTSTSTSTTSTSTTSTSISTTSTSTSTS